MNLLQLLIGTEGMKLLTRNKGDPLDQALITWPDGTPFTVRDLLRSIAIFGQTGSGKSSGSNLLLSRAIVALRGSAGLILVSKPEDVEFWQERFKEANRINDLIVFGPDEPARCNFIDFEMQSGGDSRSLTEFVMVTGESLTKGRAGKSSGIQARNGSYTTPSNRCAWRGVKSRFP